MITGALATAVLGSCSVAPIPDATPSEPTQPVHATAAARGLPALPALIQTPPATAIPAIYGPNLDQFPPDINPLSGQLVQDPALLKIPAVLVSISHFPAAARPQSGLSFAPVVYEFSITGGETRFLAAFYGQFPAAGEPLAGTCAIRRGAFEQTSALLGGRAWFDANADGVQDVLESGVPGVCVRLLDGQGAVLQETTTDTNGMYGFNVQLGASYALKFEIPPYLRITKAGVGDAAFDSDIDPARGETAPITVQDDTFHVDAGMVADAQAAPREADPATAPRPEVGPVRSGRLLYSYIGAYYQDSCLIYAFASPEVLARLPHCSFVPHNEAGGGEMLAIDHLMAVARDNMRHNASRPFDYASNAFSAVPPVGGAPARQINVSFGSLDQSGWTYDPLYGAYLRYVDNADPRARGVLHPEVDRLTGRQLHFENVVVIMVDTDVVTPSNLDIHLDEGNTGGGYLFRDGKAFAISWSTRAGEYEQRTGLRRPIRFLFPDGSPALMKPGHTWVIVVTPFSQVLSESTTYSVTYGPPAGEAR